MFLIVWFCFLWLWSIPLIILEYATGRYTRLGTVESMNQLAGPSFRFMGAWLIFVAFGIRYISCNYAINILLTGKNTHGKTFANGTPSCM